MPFEANIYSNLVPDLATYWTAVSRVPCARFLCCVARLEGSDCSKIDPYSSNDSREVFVRLLNRLIQHHAAHSLHNLTQISSQMVIQILVKISHTTKDFVVSLASDGIILVLDPQLCIT